MSQAVHELLVSLLTAVLFAVATEVAVHEGSRAGAWVSVGAFLWFSLLAARLLWRLL